MVLVEIVGMLYPRRRVLKHVLHALLVIPYKLKEEGLMCPTLVGWLETCDIILSVCPDLLGIRDTLKSIIVQLRDGAADGTTPLCPLLSGAPWTWTVLDLCIVRQARLSVGVRIIERTGRVEYRLPNLNSEMATAYLGTSCMKPTVLLTLLMY